MVISLKLELEIAKSLNFLNEAKTVKSRLHQQKIYVFVSQSWLKLKSITNVLSHKLLGCSPKHSILCRVCTKNL